MEGDRMKKEDAKKITTLGVVIFSFAAIALCFVIVLVIDMITALLVAKTAMPESVLLVGSVIGNGLGTVIATVFLTLMSRLKGIFSAAIVGVAVIMVKVIGNVVLGMGGYLTWQGAIGILFVAVFSLVGGAVGAALKK
jgi:hypothetical protein